MAQINITLDDQMVADIDRVASERGLRRPDFLRSLLAEAVEAHDEGRLAFQAAEVPNLDMSASTLVARVAELADELERSQRVNQRHEKRIVEKWNGGEEAARAAFERLRDILLDQNRKSYQPFVQKLTELYDRINGIPPQISQSIDARLKGLSARLDQIENLATRPRTVRQLVLNGDKLPMAALLSTAFSLTLLGAPIWFMVAGLFSPASVEISARLLNSPARVCRLVNRQFERDDCTVPNTIRQSGVAAIERGE